MEFIKQEVNLKKKFERKTFFDWLIKKIFTEFSLFFAIFILLPLLIYLNILIWMIK